MDGSVDLEMISITYCVSHLKYGEINHDVEDLMRFMYWTMYCYCDGCRCPGSNRSQTISCYHVDSTLHIKGSHESDINSLWPGDGDKDMSQHWLWQWLVAWRQQAITWTNADYQQMCSLAFIHQQIQRKYWWNLIWKMHSALTLLNYYHISPGSTN